jgi:hypothetical protein
MNKIEKIKIFLQTRGYDLRELKGCDLNDTDNIIRALTKQEAMETLAYYRQIEVAILGGDVFYMNQKGEICWTYDNWYCIKKKDESNVEYLERSVTEAENYINKYKNSSFKNSIFLFDIVYEILI